MQPKSPPATKSPPSPSSASPKSILINPSQIVSRTDEVVGGEETEIAAHISLPSEGGWGWVVLAASFFCMLILDGITFTYGSLLGDVAKDMNVKDSWVALINSTQIALSFIMSPLASALINRFGFRTCVMTGSIICSFSQFTAYFTSNYGALFLFYGVFNGIGCSLVNMSAGLIVGFYFERLRSMALAITSCASSVGIMSFFPINVYLVTLTGWRSVTLLHSGLLGIIFYLGMTFKPLLSLTVTVTEEPSTRLTTYLPNLSTTSALRERQANKPKQEGLKPTKTEKLFSAVSNIKFPTAAAVVDEGAASSAGQAGTSTGAVSKLTFTANTPKGGISQRQLKQVQSIMSRPNLQDKSKMNIEITVNAQPPRKRSCWARLCHWEPHIPSARPMYRDDAFYTGNVEKLPVYQKSMMETPAEIRTGLEYQLAVSRAITVRDLKEKRGICTTAVRRVLASMMDPILLKKCSFRLLCFSSFLTFVGLLVPYVFLPARNEQSGVDASHCSIFISVMGGSNFCGRLFLGYLGGKFDPLKVYVPCGVFAGASTLVSGLSYALVYQYAYCVVFGFFVAGLTSLRSVILVSLYGLDKLTNATGMVLIFAGIGNLFSTPVAGILKDKYGYDAAFYVSGSFLFLSGLILWPVRGISLRENKKEERASIPTPPTPSKASKKNNQLQ